MPDGAPGRRTPTFRMLERLVKLGALGPRRLPHPPGRARRAGRAAARALSRHARPAASTPTSSAQSVYGHPIEVVAAHELPPERSTTTELGGHLDGCRIGFDLGGSDRKVAAIIDGRVVWSEETEWDPYYQPDPQYHWDGIMDSLRRAADAPAARRRDRRQRRRRLRRQPGEVRVAVPRRRARRLRAARAEHVPRSQTRLARRPVRRGRMTATSPRCWD